MSLLDRLKNWNRKQQLRPGLISIVFNANYFIKRGVYEGVLEFGSKLSGRVLDFGCGNKPYKDLVNHSEYIGIDVKEVGHDHSEEPVDVFYDGRTIPFEDQYFDSIFSSEVIEHVFDLDFSLGEINRVLKSQGNLLITFPFVWMEHEKPHDFGRYTIFGITHLLQKHGFEIIANRKKGMGISAIAQLKNSYWYHSLFPNNRAFKLLLTVLFIFPNNLFALLFDLLLPTNEDIYLGHVILARKVN